MNLAGVGGGNLPSHTSGFLFTGRNNGRDVNIRDDIVKRARWAHQTLVVAHTFKWMMYSRRRKFLWHTGTLGWFLVFK